MRAPHNCRISGIFMIVNIYRNSNDDIPTLRVAQNPPHPRSCLSRLSKIVGSRFIATYYIGILYYTILYYIILYYIILYYIILYYIISNYIISNYIILYCIHTYLYIIATVKILQSPFWACALLSVRPALLNFCSQHLATQRCGGRGNGQVSSQTGG